MIDDDNLTFSTSQLATLTLWQQVNASLSAYTKLIKAFSSSEQALNASSSKWQKLGIHSTHIKRHTDLDSSKRFVDSIIEAIYKQQYAIVFSNEASFPQQLKQMYDPPPLLFYRGNISRVNEPQIAIVGSRNPSQHAQKITFDMAQYLAQSGYVITSGLAQGVDTQAHKGALTQQDTILKGRTVGVLGTGIDICYPKNNAGLIEQIIADEGCLISELLPTTTANKYTFPRRNRLVAGLSLATIVTEATINSGSLITARLTSEQGKQVFAVPSHIDNKNAEGCHHLIREGATLIYHPEQVIEDICLQVQQPLHQNNTLKSHTYSKPFNKNTPKNTEPVVIVSDTNHKSNKTDADVQETIPQHLHPLYQLIDWSGVDLDTIVIKLEQEAALVLGQLMELELLGVIMQQGGRYVRI